MAQPTDAVDARLPPLPIGRLSAKTLHIIGMGRSVHFRTGPWVLLAEDGSRVVRIHEGGEPPLFVAEPPQRTRPTQLPDLFGGAAPAVPDREEPRAAPAPSRARALATSSGPRRGRDARRHRTRRRAGHG